MTDLLHRRADQAVASARRTASTAARAVRWSQHNRQVLGLRRVLSRGVPPRADAGSADTGSADRGTAIGPTADAVLRRLLTRSSTR